MQAWLVAVTLAMQVATDGSSPAPETPAPATSPAASEDQGGSPPAATEAPASSAGSADPPFMAVKPMATKPPRKAKPPHVRPWWSWTGIVAGLGVSAVAAVAAVAGVGTQVLALYFWVDQGNENRKQAEREFATNRARATQWIALGLMLGGLAAFFGGLIGATYAFGYGNPTPKSAKDL